MRAELNLTRAATVAVGVALLGGSAVCIALAPLLMADSYSIIEHSISESAGQGIQGAWLARTGFLLLGFAVLIVAGLAAARWGLWGRIAHRLYGVSMIAVAAFAHMPWEEVPYDEFEDFLHSVGANLVGFSFTVGVLLVSLRRGPGHRWAQIYDGIAVGAAFVIPMIMFSVDGIAGVVQRTMFAIGYLWYGMEAIRSVGDSIKAEAA
ncbi:MAG: DUF998 domain-containing protein [Acidimicrobiia bacterium]|nr:DUF998 domain-containing protein [Acidimicrobiia bacterium]NNC93657.1 DUF998 domain-containing protein [Acidimicrobiia bacterium]